jgi:hypothetical protein
VRRCAPERNTVRPSLSRASCRAGPNATPAVVVVDCAEISAPESANTRPEVRGAEIASFAKPAWPGSCIATAPVAAGGSCQYLFTDSRRLAAGGSVTDLLEVMCGAGASVFPGYVARARGCGRGQAVWTAWWWHRMASPNIPSTYEPPPLVDGHEQRPRRQAANRNHHASTRPD